MRARFSDPQGPRWLEGLVVLPALALLVFALFSPLVGGEQAAALAGIAAILAHVPKLLFLRQRRMRGAEVSCGAGHIVIRGAGSRNQRIHARQVSGCSTARVNGGILLTLEHVGRDQPVSIEVDNEVKADEIRRALGIGHAGFGLVGWSTTLSTQRKTTVCGLVLAVIAALVYSAATALAWPLAILAVAFGGFALSGGSGIRTIAMRADGVQLPAPWGWQTLPYDELLGVDVVPYGLRFRTQRGDFDARIGGGALSAHERDSLVKQVEAAAARARGQGTPKKPLAERAEVLRRGNESAGAWLARLDTVGKLLEGAGVGYRDASLDAEDLWAIFEDPEAAPDLRAAAGRVLSHVPRPEVRTRIDAAVAAVRDASTNKRLRVAVGPDADAATRELAALEEEQRMNQARWRA